MEVNKRTFTYKYLKNANNVSIFVLNANIIKRTISLLYRLDVSLIWTIIMLYRNGSRKRKIQCKTLERVLEKNILFAKGSLRDHSQTKNRLIDSQLYNILTCNTLYD
jgi:hypothetical protein